MRAAAHNTATLLGALCCVCIPQARCAAIIVAEQTAAPGAAVIAPVVLDPQGAEISGLQFDVAWDGTALELALVLGDLPRVAGKNVYSTALGQNSLRCLLVGLSSEVLGAGDLVRLFLFVRPGATPGSYQVILSNVTATDPGGQPIPLTGTTARVNVQVEGAPLNSTILQPGGVMNAASMIAGPVTPGEIIALLGPGTATVSPAETGSGLFVTLNGARAPVLYTGPHQINAAVPFTLDRQQPLASLEVRSQNRQLAAMTVPIAPSAPGLFTQDGSGAGPAAMFNEDATMNTFSNPAARGSLVIFYGTGFGLTDPPGVEGEVATEPAGLTEPILATIGGRDAEVISAGAAPGLISGVMQFKVRVPDTAPSGVAVPIVLRVGANATQAGVTLSIR